MTFQALTGKWPAYYYVLRFRQVMWDFNGHFTDISFRERNKIWIFEINMIESYL